jgi:putative endonuclease
MLVRMFHPCVYLLASRRNGTLYCGVTSDLMRRVHEHRTNAVAGFTRAHRVHMLVWYEQHGTMATAIAREKAIKEWKRRWKLELIENGNPYWRDLFPELLDAQVAGSRPSPG